MEKFNFLTVIRGKDLESLNGSGLIGIAPTPPGSQQLIDPMNYGVAGFIAQLKVNQEFNKEFDQIFSIYLSNDGLTPGDISFGGFDLDKFAKKDKKLIWADQSTNEAYWAANGQNISFGKTPLANYNQQLILDNGMSLAMTPKKTFLHLMETLLKEHQVPCQPAKPLWACQVTDE